MASQIVIVELLVDENLEQYPTAFEQCDYCGGPEEPPFTRSECLRSRHPWLCPSSAHVHESHLGPVRSARGQSHLQVLVRGTGRFLATVPTDGETIIARVVVGGEVIVTEDGVYFITSSTMELITGELALSVLSELEPETNIPELRAALYYPVLDRAFERAVVLRGHKQLGRELGRDAFDGAAHEVLRRVDLTTISASELDDAVMEILQQLVVTKQTKEVHS